MSGVYQSLEIDSFEPDKYAELLSDANFEQRLMHAGRSATMYHDLFGKLPSTTLNRGR